MAKATYGLDFFIVQRCFSPTGAFFHTAIHTMHALWTYLCPHLCPIYVPLLTAQGVEIRGSAMQWLPYICNGQVFHCDWIDCRGPSCSVLCL